MPREPMEPATAAPAVKLVVVELLVVVGWSVKGPAEVVVVVLECGAAEDVTCAVVLVDETTSSALLLPVVLGASVSDVDESSVVVVVAAVVGAAVEDVVAVSSLPPASTATQSASTAGRTLARATSIPQPATTQLVAPETNLSLASQMHLKSVFEQPAALAPSAMQSVEHAGKAERSWAETRAARAVTRTAEYFILRVVRVGWSE